MAVIRPDRIRGSGREGDDRDVTGAFSLLHADPVVLYAPDWELYKPASPVWSIVRALAGQRVHILMGPSWFVSPPRSGILAARVARLTEAHARVKVVASCATEAEAAALQRHRLPAIHCAVSAFVREDMFTPGSGHERHFDAVYDARLSAFKRHRLARSIRSLALIAPIPCDPTWRSAPYAVFVRAALSHATWLSGPWSRTRHYLSPEEVNALYRRARVGLCLSDAEGVMFASVQYLLAGLPVLTTGSVGGRDQLFDPRYVRWVDPHPAAVAAGLDELLALDPDPAAVRAATLERVGEHRDRMQAWIRSVILAAGGDLGRWAGAWPTGLPNKLREPQVSAAAVLAELARAR